jgi:formylglycine-generating enzyme required for sulfatase activity
VQRTPIHEFQAVIDPARPLAAMAVWEQEERQQQEEDGQNRVRKERERKAEAERIARERQEHVRLALEKEALEQKPEEDRSARELLQRRPHLGLQVQSGSLVQEGTDFGGRPKWEVETRPLKMEGYREELAEGVELTMVKIPAGCFLMGSPEDELKRSADEGPQHEVTLGAFFFAQTSITQAQWRAVAHSDKVERDLNPDPSRFKGPDRPVEQVSWFDAMEFCRRLSLRTDKCYSLPSEAQWEYACRAGTATPFYFGATLTPELANYNAKYAYGNGPKGTYREQTSDVGSFPTNAWGLQDMHGNVREVCRSLAWQLRLCAWGWPTLAHFCCRSR